jgi:hypothetical protein
VDQEVVFIFFPYGTDVQGPQTAEEESQFCARQLESSVALYSQRWDVYLDRRVVGNLTATELGKVICGPAHVQAGVQQLDRVFHHAE